MYVGGNDELIKDRIAFYLKTQNGMSATVDGEVVKPQEGDFYGGWIVPPKSCACARSLRIFLRLREDKAAKKPSKSP